MAALFPAMKDVPSGQSNGCPARPYLSVAAHVAGTQHAASEGFGVASAAAL